MIYAGLDIGSVATKVVLWDGNVGRLAARALRPSGWDPRQAGADCLQEALSAAELRREDLAGIVVTGYGRRLWPGPGETVTEITCLVRGGREVAPAARTLFDIGGQDSKALTVDAAGKLLQFNVNDRCAAGTGRFLELAGQRLGVTAAELGVLAASAESTVRLSSLCAVFAESEVVGLLAEGQERSAIARGLCEAVAEQILHLAGGLPLGRPVALVGGVAYNIGVRAALERALGETVLVPEDPQMIVALGAALLAAEGAQE